MYSISSKPLLGALFSVLIMGGSNMAHSVEEPEHTLVEKVGKVEIRHYEAVVQAVTPLRSSAHTSQGFRRLAGFIFGGNEDKQEIAMTAPVQETLVDSQPELAFTMPRGYEIESLPVPNDPEVTLVEIPERTVAVIRFSGWATSAKIKRYTRQLLDTISGRDITATSEPMLNQYNPPWTPPFLRRNEIMVEIATYEQQTDSRQASLMPGKASFTY